MSQLDSTNKIIEGRQSTGELPKQKMFLTATWLLMAGLQYTQFNLKWRAVNQSISSATGRSQEPGIPEAGWQVVPSDLDTDLGEDAEWQSHKTRPHNQLCTWAQGASWNVPGYPRQSAGPFHSKLTGRKSQEYEVNLIEEWRSLASSSILV